MFLSEYLKKYNISISQLADKAGLGRQTIYTLMDGKEILLTTAVKIELATKRKVKCIDLYEEFLLIPESHKILTKRKKVS